MSDRKTKEKGSSKKGENKLSARVGIKTVTPTGHFGRFLQSILDKKRFSQTEVSRRGGIDSGNITSMISGSKRNPEFNTIKKLAVGLEEPYLRVCAELLEKEEQRPKEYWFDDRLMYIDDLMALVPAIERVKVQALIEGLQSSLQRSYKEVVAKRDRDKDRETS